MTHPDLRLATLTAGCILLLAGCGGDEAPPPVVKREAPKAPPPPPVKSVDELMADIDVDQRITWDEEDAAGSTKERAAVLRFVHAMLRADDATLSGMLAVDDRMELDAMVAEGQLSEAADAVSWAKIQVGAGLEGGQCLLVIYEVGLGYQPQFWSYDSNDDTITFRSLPAGPRLVDHLHGNWIEAFNEYRRLQVELAGRPDETLYYQIVNEDQDTASVSTGGGNSPGGPLAPGGPSQPPPGRKPGPLQPGP